MNCEYQMKNFWCHECQRNTLINILSPELYCNHCQSYLVEQIIPNEPHPSHFLSNAPSDQFSNQFIDQELQFQQAPFSSFQMTTIRQTPTGTVVITESSNNLRNNFNQESFMSPIFMGPTTFAPVFNFGTFGNLGGMMSLFQQNIPEESGPMPADRQKIDNLKVLRGSEVSGDCTVCQDGFKGEERVKQLPCSHCFHASCIDPWLEMHDSCPVCRQGISS